MRNVGALSTFFSSNSRFLRVVLATELLAVLCGSDTF